MYYLGARCGPSRTRAARPILRYVLSASLTGTEDDPLAARQAFEPDRTARMQLVRRNADLRAEPVFEAVGEARRRVHENGARVDLAQESHCTHMIVGDDPIGVLRAILRDVVDCVIDTVDDAHGKDRRQVFGVP